MGKYWLFDLVEPLQAEFGNDLEIYPGAETRSRRSGGFDEILGAVWHHDADPIGGSDDNVIKYEYINAGDRPIGNFHIRRNGTIVFGAMGASNHAGKGGPVKCSKGTVPLDAGNRFLLGVEFSNNGMGEPWPKVQVVNGLRLFNVFFRTYGLTALTDLFGHWTWVEPSCPGRKVDPAGPTPSHTKFGGTTGAVSWNMNEVRKAVYALSHTTKPPTEDREMTEAEMDEIVTRVENAVWSRVMPVNVGDPPEVRNMQAEHILREAHQLAGRAVRAAEKALRAVT